MFFILKLMNTLAIRTAELPKGTSSVPILLGYAVMILALAQSLLAVASALNMKNVSAATN